MLASENFQSPTPQTSSSCIISLCIDTYCSIFVATVLQEAWQDIKAVE